MKLWRPKVARPAESIKIAVTVISSIMENPRSLCDLSLESGNRLKDIKTPAHSLGRSICEGYMREEHILLRKNMQVKQIMRNLCSSHHARDTNPSATISEQ